MGTIKPTAIPKLIGEQLEDLRTEIKQKLENQSVKHDADIKELREKHDRDVRDLKQCIAKHEKEIAKHEKEIIAKLRQHEADEQLLMIRQLAFEIEKAIIDKVLSRCAIPRHNIFRLSQMFKAIEGNQEFVEIFGIKNKHTKESNRERAKSQWENLQKELLWDERMCFTAMRSLKELGRDAAHPKFNVVAVKRTLELGILNSEVREDCENLLSVYAQLYP